TAIDTSGDRPMSRTRPRTHSCTANSCADLRIRPRPSGGIVRGWGRKPAKDPPLIMPSGRSCLKAATVGCDESSFTMGRCYQTVLALVVLIGHLQSLNSVSHKTDRVQLGQRIQRDPGSGN